MTRLIIALIVVFVIYLFISQISMPMIRGTNLFPIFDKVKVKYKNRLKQARAKKEDLKLKEKALLEEFSIYKKENSINEIEESINNEDSLKS